MQMTLKQERKLVHYIGINYHRYAAATEKLRRQRILRKRPIISKDIINSTDKEVVKKKAKEMYTCAS